MNRVWLEPQSRAALMAPPLWFVGLQEAAVGRHHRRILPAAAGCRRVSPRPRRGRRALYTGARALFPGLALTAVGQARGGHRCRPSLLFAWNNRRMVPPPPATATAGWLRRGVGAAARLVIRHPETQASFFFTLQALLRSPQHRLTIAASLAFGLTASVFAVAVGQRHARGRRRCAHGRRARGAAGAAGGAARSGSAMRCACPRSSRPTGRCRWRGPATRGRTSPAQRPPGRCSSSSCRCWR